MRLVGGRSGDGADAPGARRASGNRRAVSFLTGADRFVLYALVGAGLLLMLVPRASTDGTTAIIEGVDGQRRVVSLSKDATIDVSGPLGTTTVIVEGGKIRIASSPCPHRICVAAGPISRPGESAVCVPNGVVVRVLGAQETDATTR